MRDDERVCGITPARNSSEVTAVTDQETSAKPSDLGLTIHEILRYGYGGFLAFLVAAIISPAETKKVSEALGTAASIAVALAAGVAFYMFGRTLLGWLMEIIHDTLHRVFFEPRLLALTKVKNACDCTSRRHYLERKFTISWWDSLNAFRVLRDSKYFDQIKGKNFYRQHSEVYILYLTSYIFLAAAILSSWFKPQATYPVNIVALFGSIAVVALIGGLLSDILLSKQECAYIKTLDQDAIKDLLKPLAKDNQAKRDVSIWKCLAIVAFTLSMVAIISMIIIS